MCSYPFCGHKIFLCSQNISLAQNMQLVDIHQMSLLNHSAYTLPETTYKISGVDLNAGCGVTSSESLKYTGCPSINFTEGGVDVLAKDVAF